MISNNIANFLTKTTMSSMNSGQFTGKLVEKWTRNKTSLWVHHYQSTYLGEVKQLAFSSCGEIYVQDFLHDVSESFSMEMNHVNPNKYFKTSFRDHMIPIVHSEERLSQKIQTNHVHLSSSISENNNRSIKYSL
eukprot:TRINITY_DN8687_c0_g1_i1.p1 TRINITY_DN8687_c0_g1~~TRINITY_DN8687_c0_g1_i1.p1  ORF type:complete len:134 (-),score=38.01 TRINITY_DN8687_c0_g1_i1:214-615(-)